MYGLEYNESLFERGKKMSNDTKALERLDSLFNHFDKEFMSLYVYEIDEIEDCLSEEEKETASGCSYVWRLSAAAYMDCTDWQFAKTINDLCDDVELYFMD